MEGKELKGFCKALCDAVAAGEPSFIFRDNHYQVEDAYNLADRWTKEEELSNAAERVKVLRMRRKQKEEEEKEAEENLERILREGLDDGTLVPPNVRVPNHDCTRHLLSVIREGLKILVNEELIAPERAEERARNLTMAITDEFEIFRREDACPTQGD